MNLGDNIKFLRKQKGLTQEQLSNLLNELYPNTVSFNKGKISKWENNKETPYLSSAKIIADYFKTTVDDLINNDFTKSIYGLYSKLEPPRQQKVYNFATYELKEQETITVYGETAAGSPVEYNDQYEIQEEKVSYIPKGTDGALVVRGNSMSPTLEDGDLLFFEKTPQVENGEIAVVEIKGEAVTTKKVRYNFENEIIILESINPDFDDIKFKSEDVKIIGRVLL